MPWELQINKSLIFYTFQLGFLNSKLCVHHQALGTSNLVILSPAHCQYAHICILLETGSIASIITKRVEGSKTVSGGRGGDLGGSVG